MCVGCVICMCVVCCAYIVLWIVLLCCMCGVVCVCGVCMHLGSHMGPVHPPDCSQPFSLLLDPPSTLKHGLQKLLAEGTALVEARTTV